MIPICRTSRTTSQSFCGDPLVHDHGEGDRSEGEGIESSISRIMMTWTYRLGSRSVSVPGTSKTSTASMPGFAPRSSHARPLAAMRLSLN